MHMLMFFIYQGSSVRFLLLKVSCMQKFHHRLCEVELMNSMETNDLFFYSQLWMSTPIILLDRQETTPLCFVVWMSGGLFHVFAQLTFCHCILTNFTCMWKKDRRYTSPGLRYRPRGLHNSGKAFCLSRAPCWLPPQTGVCHYNKMPGSSGVNVESSCEALCRTLVSQKGLQRETADISQSVLYTSLMGLLLVTDNEVWTKRHKINLHFIPQSVLNVCP